MISKIIIQAKVIVSALVLTAFMLSSCTDNFENYNRNPGEPTEEEIAGYLDVVVFGQMIDNVYSSQENSYQMNQNLIGDPYGRHLSITNRGFTTPFSTFNANDGWINYPFNDVFSKFYGAWFVLRKNNTEESSRHLLEWANILRVAAMHRLGDMYGPIPYSQVGKGGINTSYDSVEELYKNMISDLDSAIDYLTDYVEKNPDSRPLVEPKGDVIYGADLKKWVVFANSLKLRLAMRTVYADPAFAKTKSEEAVSHKLGVLKSNDENPKYTFAGGINPVYKMSTEWGDSAPAADIITYMLGYNDPRLPLYFTPATLEGAEGEYLGVRTGITLDEKSVMSTYSRVTTQPQDPMIWMTAAEVAFLKAEGALRGWNMGGSAQALYEEGVNLSFNQWGASGADAYLQDSESTQANYVNPHKVPNPKYDKNNPNKEPQFLNMSIDAISKITIKWNPGASFEENLERIVTQKWIAIYPLATEAWTEQRRTGYPRFFPVMINASDEPLLTNQLASRIPFAPQEKENNPENYADGVKKLGGPDKYGTRLWWDAKPNKPNF